MRIMREGFDRVQTSGEEIANSISHGVGLIAAVAGALFIIIQT